MSMVQLIYVWLLIIKLHLLWYIMSYEIGMCADLFSFLSLRIRYWLSSVLITRLNEHAVPKQTNTEIESSEVSWFQD